MTHRQWRPGDTADGFGKGIFSFEPALLIGQILPRVGFVQLQGGAEFSTDPGVARHVLFWRGAVGRTFRQGGDFGRQWSPMVEILGATEIDDGVSPDWEPRARSRGAVRDLARVHLLPRRDDHRRRAGRLHRHQVALDDHGPRGARSLLAGVGAA